VGNKNWGRRRGRGKRERIKLPCRYVVSDFFEIRKKRGQGRALDTTQSGQRGGRRRKETCRQKSEEEGLRPGRLEGNEGKKEKSMGVYQIWGGEIVRKLAPASGSRQIKGQEGVMPRSKGDWGGGWGGVGGGWGGLILAYLEWD